MSNKFQLCSNFIIIIKLISSLADQDMTKIWVIQNTNIETFYFFERLCYIHLYYSNIRIYPQSYVYTFFTKSYILLASISLIVQLITHICIVRILLSTGNSTWPFILILFVILGLLSVYVCKKRFYEWVKKI